MIDFDKAHLDYIADNLVDKGYVVLDGMLAPSLLSPLLAHFNQLQSVDFKPAGIGRQADFQVQTAIRSDQIHWIGSEVAITRLFLQYMESLRVGINQRLFMGLFDYESHFAYYPAGAFYKKHVDAFGANRKQGQANRVLSTVLYLNENWHQGNGGELLIYEESGEKVIETVAPLFGRFVIFLSEKFPHEVLPAVCERKSIAGWFRINEGVI